jgi:AAT family amino acid transporter
MPNASFQKALKPHHILAIAMGGTISSSYFLGNGYVLAEVGPLAFTLFFLGGIITYLTMECFAELVTSDSEPKHPSFIGYAKKFVSPMWACGVGWAYWLNWVIYICVECIAAGILLNLFLPEVSIYAWSMICASFVTLINLGHVKIFGTASFWLTFTHLTLFIGFSVMALLIYFGAIGTPHEFIGTKYFLSEGLFPKGIAVLFINMVIMMLNYQGTEVIGLSASEANRPKKDIPKIMRQISLTVMGLYVVPIFLLALIFPWQKATLVGSVFALALESYGFGFIAKAFTLFIIAGSLSCANSGLYAAVRSIHALSELGLSPKWFCKLNRYGMPYRAVGVTIVILFMLLQVGYFRPFHEVYISYLILAGCIGTAVWTSICVCQVIFRRSLSMAAVKAMPYKVKWFPYLSYFAIISQGLFLVFALLSPDLRASFYVMVPAFAVPMIWYKYRRVV